MWLKLLMMNLVIMAICLIFPLSLLSDTSINIAWDKNSEIDIWGYRVYWGTSPSKYDNFFDVGDRTQFKLYEIEKGVKYYIVTTALDWWGNESEYSNVVSSWIGDAPQLPKELALSGNYPNPFNPGTFLNVELPETVELEISVFNMLGQQIKHILDQEFDAGFHNIYWDGTNNDGLAVPAGVYFVQLEANNEIKVRPVTLVR